MQICNVYAKNACNDVTTNKRVTQQMQLKLKKFFTMQ